MGAYYRQASEAATRIRSLCSIFNTPATNESNAILAWPRLASEYATYTSRFASTGATTCTPARQSLSNQSAMHRRITFQFSNTSPTQIQSLIYMPCPLQSQPSHQKQYYASSVRLTNNQFSASAYRNYSEAADNDADSGSVSSEKPQYTPRSSLANRRIYGALILTRLPSIVPPQPTWQVEWYNHSQETKQHQLKSYPQQLRDQDFLTYAQRQTLQRTGQRDFEPNPRDTPADTVKDTLSLNRRLDQRLYFMVKKRSTFKRENARASLSGGGWQFPDVQHQGDETILETAQRALFGVCGDVPENQVHYVGNAPCGHVSVGDTAYGGDAIFYMKAQLMNGEVTLRDEKVCEAQGWFTKDEIIAKCADKETQKIFDIVL